METRLYTVTYGYGASNDGDERLVEAANKAQALRFVAAQILTVEIATTKDVARLVAAGVKIESATEVAP